MSPRASDRFQLQVSETVSDARDLAREIEEGMRSTPKRIPCRFFYDETGSKLFEEICAQPEYYLTRAEDEILLRRAGEIAGRAPEGCDLVELGSGDARKTRRLLSALLERRPSLRYVPIDISRSALERSARSLLAVHPELSIHGIAAEYERGLALLRAAYSGPKLVLWLGSNVGNLEREAAASFLRGLGLRRAAGDRLLIGIDLRKSRGVLEPAYDDARGVTARFNRNLLVRLNSELDAEFDPERFRHVAFYNEEAGRIEMHLESATDQVVPIRKISLDLPLRRGERIHTESSYKYSPEEIEALAAGAGMRVESVWLDSEGRFSLNLFAPLE
ncbi:MAG: L-histidine N(alpha)-methyltransferase [Planctomycetota bacterium]